MGSTGYLRDVIIFVVIFNLFINCVLIDGRKNRERQKSKSSVSRQTTKEEIQARIEDFVKKWNENDMRGVAEISAKNGKLMGQGIPTLDGRRDILGGLLEAKKSLDKIYITVDDIFAINKKFAYHTENWKAFDKEGRMLLGNGRSLVVWKKIGSQWYIIRDMFNDSGILQSQSIRK